MTAWLAAHRWSVLFLLSVAGLGGAAAAYRLPVSLFPVIDFPRIVVSVDAGDRPVERMVVEVTRPLEQVLRAVPEIADIRSTSSRGSADLSLTFDWSTRMVDAALQVEAAVNRARADLPPGTRFEVRRMDPTIFPVLGLTLTSSTRDLVALRDVAYYQLRPIIASVRGVAAVEVLGGRVAEFQARVDPDRLRAAGLSIDEVEQAIGGNNGITSVGRLEDRFRLYLTLVDAQLHSVADVAALPLRAGPKGLVALRDVADVSLGVAPVWTRVTANGRDAVVINVRQARGANTPELVKAISEQLALHRDEFPRDVQLGTFYDQSELISASAAGVRDSILIGAILAGLTLYLFLRDWRLTVVVGVMLPAVLAITSLLLSLFGMSFNLMTLGGLAAAVGLVVDDGVVMIEHLVRRQQESAGHGDVSLLAAARVMVRALVGSSLATVVVFVPLAFLSGVAGGFFRALALTMASALVVSLLVALLAVPLLTERVLAQKRGSALPAAPRFYQRIAEAYDRGADWVLRRRATGLIAAGLLCMLGAAALFTLPSGFMPHLDEGGFVLDYRALPGTSLTETDRLLRHVEAKILATPEVASYSRRTGLQLGGGLTEPDEGDFFIRLKPLPRRQIEAVMADIRDQVLADTPGLQIETAQLMEDLIGDLTAVPQPIEVKLFGPDVRQLQQLSPIVATRIAKVDGVVEVLDGRKIAGDALRVRVDPVRMALEGGGGESVRHQLGTIIGGTVAGQIQAGEKLLDVRLWSQPASRDRLSALENVNLRSADGRDFPVRRVATFDIESGEPQLQRENLAAMVAITGRLEGRDLGSAVAEVKRAVTALALPHEVRVEYGGLYAEQQRSFRGLMAVFAAAALLVTALLLYLYERWTIVAAILATIAMSVAVVFIGLWVTRTELNISAMMGLTMIIGIVAEIAIFYFAELDLLLPVDRSALAAAGRRRLRPILMTSAIAILALLPLAIGLGAGAGMQRPLAIAIVSGLVGAVPLVLFVMPSLCLRFERSRSGESSAGPSAPPPDPSSIPSGASP